MPKQGQSVESCILTEIPKKVGDKITKGELLFAYETDKASFEEFAPVDGVLLAFYYGSGDEVQVLKEVCVIGEPGEKVAAGQFDVSAGPKSEPLMASVKEEKMVVPTSVATSETAQHPKIRLLTYAEVESVDGYIGNFKVRIRLRGTGG